MDGNRSREDATGFAARRNLIRRDALTLLAGGLLMPSPGTRPRGALVFFSRAKVDGALHYASPADVAALIETEKLSPADLTRQMLDRIAALDGSLHSYVTIMADAAMESARRAEIEIGAGRYRGPLHGVPIAEKDLCNTRGVRTMAGTKVLPDFIPDFDATVVTRPESAGAVILGKLALCEVAFGPYHPGLQVPVNPWDVTRWSVLSSSGSGVATAAGLCVASVGTDTGGSIRNPEALPACGLAEGLPQSVQFVGRRLNEAVLRRLGHAFERTTEWHLRRPAVRAAREFHLTRASAHRSPSPPQVMPGP